MKQRDEQALAILAYALIVGIVILAIRELFEFIERLP